MTWALYAYLPHPKSCHPFPLTLFRHSHSSQPLQCAWCKRCFSKPDKLYLQGSNLQGSGLPGPMERLRRSHEEGFTLVDRVPHDIQPTSVTLLSIHEKTKWATV